MNVYSRIIRLSSIMHARWGALIVLYCLAGPAFSQAPDTCGVPALDPSTEAGLFLWEENCGNSVRSFNVRALQGGMTMTRTYEGRVDSDQAFSSMNGVSLESNDLLELLNGNLQIHYRMSVSSPYKDGFGFSVSSTANVCFGVDLPAGTLVRVGPNKTPVAVPFCPRSTSERLNIVVILSDDQRWDTLSTMPSVQALASEGISFSNAFVSYPVCGPARATILSGGFRASNTGIISNNQAIAKLSDYNDRDTPAVQLQQAGYQTFFTGKYINGYETMLNYVPPGWTRWVANRQSPNEKWFNYSVTVGSSGDQSSTGAKVGPIAQYVTDYHRDQILSFLDGVGNDPFFVFWAAFPPHEVATPALEDENLFPDFLYRERAWGETDLSDKPSWVRNPNRFASSKAPNDEFPRKQLRSLQALDRGVKAIVDKVAEIGAADRTVFFVLSDNGLHWGEHGLSDKGVAYEESLRVPLVVFGAGIAPGIEDRMVLADLDLGPTIMELAGIAGRPSDGLSLEPLLHGETPTWRNSIFVESWGQVADGPYNTWAALRTDRWKYIQQANGEEELYDLLADPYEEQSLHLNSAFNPIRLDLAGQLNTQKSVALKTYSPKAGTAGIPYSLQLKAWGGSGNYRWIIESGLLPNGLILNPNTGLISGTPSSAGKWEVTIKVEDGTIGTHSGLPRQHRYLYKFTIG